VTDLGNFPWCIDSKYCRLFWIANSLLQGDQDLLKAT